MQRRAFLAGAVLGGVGIPTLGLGLARARVPAAPEGAHPLPARPLPLPSDGVVQVAFVVGRHMNVIDTAGPWEVFQDAGAGTGGSSPFSLFTVAATTDPVEATGGLTIVPHHDFARAPRPHVVVVPAHHASSEETAWLRRTAAGADVVMSVCTGAFVLAEAGLLPAGGHRSRPHPEAAVAAHPRPRERADPGPLRRTTSSSATSSSPDRSWPAAVATPSSSTNRRPRGSRT